MVIEKKKHTTTTLLTIAKFGLKTGVLIWYFVFVFCFTNSTYVYEFQVVFFLKTQRFCIVFQFNVRNDLRFNLTIFLPNE